VDAVKSSLDALRHWFEHPELGELPRLFAPSFLAHLPPPELKNRLDMMTRELGLCTELRICEPMSDRSARIEGIFQHGYSAHGVIGVDEETPPRIQWLVFELPTRRSDSWADIERDVRAMPGRVSFEMRNLSTDTVLAAVEPEQPLGIGSVSKLFILSTLLDAIDAGTRRWEDVLTLKDRDRSLPTGILQDWPSDAPITLHSAAVLLISISDNTAADMLIRELGRDAVERSMQRTGSGDSTPNLPFLSTRGLFTLVIAPEFERRAYLQGNEAERRAMLAAAEEKPRPDISQLTGEWPEGFDWYFSARTVCATLDLLRRRLAGSSMARKIFEVNSGGFGLGQWRFSGFKGGSSPGRTAFATLLETDGGEWVGTALVHNAKPDGGAVEACARLVKRAADQLRATTGA